VTTPRGQGRRSREVKRVRGGRHTSISLQIFGSGQVTNRSSHARGLVTPPLHWHGRHADLGVPQPQGQPAPDSVL